MTVIQPIFYGGSGSGDVKLKALKPQYNSVTLAKNQSIDFTVTPELDLSKLDLYSVSCDDPRVIIERRDGDKWHVGMPDEKIPNTTITQLHLRANDDSGVNVDVPITLQAGLTESEARGWFESHRSSKQLTPSFEPLPGWKPFKNYASGAEIIARAIRDGKRYMVNVGDYFDETVNGTTYRWTIVEFNHYGRNEALMVPDKLIPGDGTFGSNNTYSGSNLESRFNDFYNSMPASLKSYVLVMTLPWTDSNGSQSAVVERVFPPSEIEAFGTKHYSKESSNSYRKWACFTDDGSRVRSNRAYWLRSTCADDSSYVPVVYDDGSNYYYNSNGSYGACPCFCIA
jgi:hypothetical protein|nr:MAG TPA: hypothetical protein [Caudoviricetes sp.]